MRTATSEEQAEFKVQEELAEKSEDNWDEIGLEIVEVNQSPSDVLEQVDIQLRRCGFQIVVYESIGPSQFWVAWQIERMPEPTWNKG